MTSTVGLRVIILCSLLQWIITFIENFEDAKSAYRKNEMKTARSWQNATKFSLFEVNQHGREPKKKNFFSFIGLISKVALMSVIKGTRLSHTGYA